jgi:peptidoglycan/xylan/chitin deacetylase (PgdA/CDA1 family)
MKYITVFFDFEGKWGMPFETNYDLEKTVIKILKILKRYHVKAVFNTCGKIIEVYPNIIKKIDREGHEIAFHGYMHEDFNKISIKKLNQLLEKTEKIFSPLTGKRLLGFRAPFLLAPNFYNKKIYQLFRKRGYKWCSNREIRFVEEALVQHRVKGSIYNPKNAFSKLISISKITSVKFCYYFLFNLLNIRLILMEDIHKVLNKSLIINDIKPNLRILRNFNWLNYSRFAISKLKILDFPLYSPLDCDLFEYPFPSEESNEIIMNYTFKCLVKNFQMSKHFFNLNFHDWIIGTANRYKLLDKILNYLSHQESVKIILPNELLKILKEPSRKI